MKKSCVCSYVSVYVFSCVNMMCVRVCIQVVYLKGSGGDSGGMCEALVPTG